MKPGKSKANKSRVKKTKLEWSYQESSRCISPEPDTKHEYTVHIPLKKDLIVTATIKYYTYSNNDTEDLYRPCYSVHVGVESVKFDGGTSFNSFSVNGTFYTSLDNAFTYAEEAMKFLKTFLLKSNLLPK